MVEFKPDIDETPGADEEQAVVEAQQEADEQPLVDVETVEMVYPRPRGAFLFVMLLIMFYIVYWSVSYFEIFIVRGG